MNIYSAVAHWLDVVYQRRVKLGRLLTPECLTGYLQDGCYFFTS